MYVVLLLFFKIILLFSLLVSVFYICKRVTSKCISTAMFPSRTWLRVQKREGCRALGSLRVPHLQCMVKPTDKGEDIWYRSSAYTANSLVDYPPMHEGVKAVPATTGMLSLVGISPWSLGADIPDIDDNAHRVAYFRPAERRQLSTLTTTISFLSCIAHATAQAPCGRSWAEKIRNFEPQQSQVQWLEILAFASHVHKYKFFQSCKRSWRNCMDTHVAHPLPYGPCLAMTAWHNLIRPHAYSKHGLLPFRGSKHKV